MTNDNSSKTDSPSENQSNTDPNNIQKMEELQLELQQNPRSLSFAPLTDLYLAENMTDEAYLLVERSLKYHPHSVSGMILMARIFQLRADLQNALPWLDKAIERAPTNWVAHYLRADIYLKQGQRKKALLDFKKVMLLNPQHLQARRAVAKLDVITADEFEDDVFSIQSIHDISQQSQNMQLANQNTAASAGTDPQWSVRDKKLDRILSLIDAFTVRQEYDRALKLLKETQTEFGQHPEIQTRLLRLSHYESAEKIRPKSELVHLLAREELIRDKQQRALELLLRRIQKFKEDSPLG